MNPIVTVVLLLIGSNAFMTVAWYGHLKHRDAAWYSVIFVSWIITLPEYALQVPANRLGYGHLSATQLKVIQEAISVSVRAWRRKASPAAVGRTPRARAARTMAVAMGCSSARSAPAARPST